MKYFILFSILILVSFTPFISSQSPGELDLNFGNGGKVITDVTGSSDGAWDIAIQPDGKIILAGYSFPATSSYREITLIRYLPNGDIDIDFATNGIATFDVSDREADVFSVGLQNDGKIVAAGESRSSSTGKSDFTVVRLDNMGNPDNTFGTNGVVITDIQNYFDRGNSLVIQPDGKILVAGYTSGYQNADIAIIRLDSNGNLDNSFGVNGKVITDINSMSDVCKDVALQADGKIVVAGYSSNGNFIITVVRYLSTGILDETFGNGGIVMTQIGNEDAFGQAVTIQEDGKILVAGKSNSSGNYHFTLIRYNTDGSLDNSFGNGGIRVTIIGIDSEANSIAIDQDGYIIAGGRTYSGNHNFALARYNENGNLDTSFGINGIVITNFGGSSQEFGRSLALQSDGKILLASEIFINNDIDFAVARYYAELDPVPVELISFTASVNNRQVLLKWETATELDNYGFDIERSVIDEGWKKIGFIEGHGNSNSLKSYLFTDNNPIGGWKFKYRLKQIDNDGKFEYSNEVEVEIVPLELTLLQNYPNPFNPTTTINYQIPEFNYVTLKVYDVLGNRVASLVSEEKPAGSYEVEFDGSELTSGIYYYKIKANNFIETKKMMLLK